jgi:phosphoglycerate dehydrogenase-like enzyme
VFVVWGNQPSQLKEVAGQLGRVRLVQTLMAGADAVVAAGFRDEAVIASGIGMHDRTVAEHTLALMLALVRKLPTLHEAKKEHRWAREIGGRQPLYTKPVTTLIDTNLLLWGFGSIAKTLAPLLTALGANVKGAARSAGEREGYEVVAEQALADELARTDILVMILPDTPETRHALNAERLAQLPDHAFVVNVGRGATVDEDALAAALGDGSIAGAAVDVTSVEPLPAEAPLWDAPNLIITPHSAGGRPIGASELVMDQIRALEAGQELRNLAR